MLGIGLECLEKVHIKLWNKKLHKLFGIKLWERVRQVHYLLKVRCILGILQFECLLSSFNGHPTENEASYVNLKRSIYEGR